MPLIQRSDPRKSAATQKAMQTNNLKIHLQRTEPRHPATTSRSSASVGLLNRQNARSRPKQTTLLHTTNPLGLPHGIHNRPGANKHRPFHISAGATMARFDDTAIEHDLNLFLDLYGCLCVTPPESSSYLLSKCRAMTLNPVD
jgi:hypothetical protein